MLGIVFLYQRKFEIQTIPFITIFSFITVCVYGFIFSLQSVFLTALIAAPLSGGIFFLLAHFNTSRASCEKNYINLNNL